MSVVFAISAIVAMAAVSGARASVPMPAPHKHHRAHKPHRAHNHRRGHKRRDPTCVVHSLPSFVESGLGGTASSVADVITVECEPVYAEQTVTISSDELSSRCHGTLGWYIGTAPFFRFSGPSVDVVLDNDGNATVVAFGGPSCAAGRSIVSAHLDVAPFATANATYKVIAPRDTPRGVKALPKSLVEDSVTSSAATIVYAEFPSYHAEQTITIRSDELNSRCAEAVAWVGSDGVVLGDGPSVTTTLDNNGNAWVVALAGPSCAAGKSQLEASLTSAPFTSYVTSFNILSPRVTNP
ncbi:MAG: hypothetical protein JO240_09720 [Solirubrobacterales bacterium]|nr:hypothetical protein [Solirubrobacterales bacterium]